MARRSDVQPTYSVTWRTLKPFVDEPRLSSSFPLLGSQWNLHFCVEEWCQMYYYRISLRQGTTTKTLENSIIVTFVIQNIKSRGQVTDSSCVTKTNEVLFKCSKCELVKTFPGCEEYGNWKITCLFHDVEPPRLTYATIPLSTQTDFDWPSRPTSDLDSLSQDLISLLEQECNSDVQLRCGGNTFPAHRSILTARSKVFAAMFRNKMAERETGTVDVTDMDAEEFYVFLKYVYSGKLPELSCDTASNLYAAGDKYRIQALKEACSQLIVERLTPENCLSLLVLADAHSDEAFKEKVVHFIANNLNSLKGDAWSGFNEDHPGLAVSVYQRRYKRTLPKKA